MISNPNEHHQTTDRVASKAHDAVDSAAESAARAEEYAREQSAHADDALNQAFSYVRRNPLISIVAAFVAGLLFSFLKSRQ